MTDDNMPEPVAWLGTGGTIWLTYRTAVKHCAKPMPLHTADQLRAALAAQAEKHAAEIEALRCVLHEIAEEWAGAECGEPVHAQEAYAIGLAKRMYLLAAAALRPNVADKRLR